jgi:hypothetical protein
MPASYGPPLVGVFLFFLVLIGAVARRHWLRRKKRERDRARYYWQPDSRASGYFF